MKPWLLVSTVAQAIVAVFTVLAAAAAGMLLAGDEGGRGRLRPELHAASAAAAPAAVGSARNSRRRAGRCRSAARYRRRLGRESFAVS